MIKTVFNIFMMGAIPTLTAVAMSSMDPLSSGKKENVQELIIVDKIEGTGAEAKAGDTVSVHYTGTLLNGTKFDSSHDRGIPFVFKLGGGQVIKGWDQGVEKMKVGGKRHLTIPAHLAYGERGAGAVIPPGATLVFEIELLQVS